MSATRPAPLQNATFPETTRMVTVSPAELSPAKLREGDRFCAELEYPGARRSPYDQFMHECHNAMKEDTEFQRTTPKRQWEFPPNSTWIVLTDCVSHAVLSGQYALEQTFIISRSAMVRPEMAPAAILERLAGYSLTNAV